VHAGSLPETDRRPAHAETIDSVQQEIDSFKSDLLKGGKDARYWATQLRKEIPYLFGK
jgi:hypothetical protein